MLNKRDIINFLYVITFPVWGIGVYISAAFSPSIGYIAAIFVPILIILFYLIDIVYKREFTLRINWVYFLVIVLQLVCIASLFISLYKHIPGQNLIGVATKSILLVVPFQAFIIVFLYNEKHKESFVKLTFYSWSLLLLINMVGFFGLGITNQLHSIEGRVAFPFLDGFYSGACLLAILNLVLVFYIKKAHDNPLRLTYLIAYFIINLVLLYMINSRLTLMIFLAVFILFAFNLSRRLRGIFLISIFTLPLLLNMGILMYRILSLPVFVAIMRRVDLADVTTFNGRSFLWQRALDWLIYDQRGLFFGNGAGGHYFLHLIPDLAKKWLSREENIHLHSTVLMTLVDQGIFGYGLLLLLCYRTFLYYRNSFQKSAPDGGFFAVVVFLIFVMQVDTFVYMGSLGYVILMALAARVSLNLKFV